MSTRVDKAVSATDVMMTGLSLAILMQTESSQSARQRFNDFTLGVQSALTEEEYVEFSQRVQKNTQDLMNKIRDAGNTNG